ncbi:hypothetical protein [Microbulbifer hydrolyticus]|uniref:Uncharacterized protein n=1 Tax=Microbulbifer hydrolyticus TaxID=48074 RepID=A0A6P1T9J1_9GAMM|nr:hypothetical protein [Microbulbifer hydrolyticus]MBB5211343.1 hypothetical protein [Microbulbifer hydrolyticus]QHQ37899.1 hypothetical protein GTQ55_02065 [Microbulbifer hydrolyticus]
MKICQAAQQFKKGALDEIQLRKNPSDVNQWFVMLRKQNGDLLMLADEQDEPIVDGDLTRLMGVLKSIGCKEARVFL